MAQEFTINSTAIEDKINKLLPSQGGSGAGIDFSASTMVIPIVDLTETAEGSLLRQDLQSSFSHNGITSVVTSNETNEVWINTTGYWRVFGSMNVTSSGICEFNLFDGSTSKVLIEVINSNQSIPYDFIVFLGAGDSLRATSNAQGGNTGCFKQLASLDGTLTTPS